MKARKVLSGVSIAGITVISGANWAPAAGPLPGEVLKFQQLPLGGLATNPNTPAPGHDEPSTATLLSSSNAYTGTFAADDFSDNVSSPIVDVQWWGSYIDGATAPPPAHVSEFLISFESNIPAGPTGGFSEPGTPLLSQTVLAAPSLVAGSGTFTETPVPALPGPDGALYQYNAELKLPFPEIADTTYWLKIVALTTPNSGIEWGWHNRDYSVPDPLAAPPGDVNIGTGTFPIWHYEDDAVSGSVVYAPGQIPQESGFKPLFYNSTTDGIPAGISASEDLAFSLYYNVPEPVGLPLLATGMFFLRRQRRQG